MRIHMIENLIKLTQEVQFSVRLYSYLRNICVRTARACNDYDINPNKTS
jgi:hypothetical protein